MYDIHDNNLGWSLKKEVKRVTKQLAAPVVKTVAQVKRTVKNPVFKNITKTLLNPIKAAKIGLNPLKQIKNIKTQGINMSQDLVNIPTQPAGTTGTAQDIYLDSDGKQITKAQYDKLLAEQSGPIIKIYSPYGDEAEIPTGMLKNGVYVDEEKNTWTTQPPKQVTIYSMYGDEAQIYPAMLQGGMYIDEQGNQWSTSKPKQVTIYSPYGDEAQVPEGMLQNGLYVDEQGNVWSSTKTSIAPAAPVPATINADTNYLTPFNIASNMGKRLNEAVQSLPQSAPTLVASNMSTIDQNRVQAVLDQQPQYTEPQYAEPQYSSAPTTTSEQLSAAQYPQYIEESEYIEEPEYVEPSEYAEEPEYIEEVPMEMQEDIYQVEDEDGNVYTVTAEEYNAMIMQSNEDNAFSGFEAGTVTSSAATTVGIIATLSALFYLAKKKKGGK